jgi:hypothetical protein
MNWSRLEVLVNRLSTEVEEFGYFMRARGQRQHQEGVFRTNCIDCLDRTNVVQGLLARLNLEQVLKVLTLAILMNFWRIGFISVFLYTESQNFPRY